MTFRRYLFVLLKDVAKSSTVEVMIGGRIFMIRINSMLADQKQERSCLCLKSVGSFMDCTNCTVPTREHTADGEVEEKLQENIVALTSHDVYNIQT